MLKRFTERARQVVVLAQDESRALGHDWIGTEHLLLGLLREEVGLAARVLASLGVSLEEARAGVERVVGRGDAQVTGEIPFTPRAKKVLELALREAVSLGHNYIGTEHVLLGLVREDDGVGARILLDFGADAEKVRNEIIRKLSGAAPGPPEPALAAELEKLRAEKEEALEAREYERAARLRDRERELRGVTPPSGWTAYGPRMERGGFHLFLGWVLFAVALGIGLLLGWLLWGL